MAQITVSPDFDLEAIAVAAGNGDVEARYYAEGILYVEGVDQQSLHNALANYVHDDLKGPLAQGKGEVDTAAELARLRYITNGAGQAAVYTAKLEEAIRYRTDGYPIDTSAYQWVQADAGAFGMTGKEAADAIIETASRWATIGSSIEFLRLKAKADMANATTVEELKAIEDAAVAQLNAI